jgi:hypothetical protein
MGVNNAIAAVRAEFARDFTSMMLRIGIIVWALVVVIAALTVKSKWILAGILAWEILP